MNDATERELDRQFARLAAGDRSVLPAVFRSIWHAVHRFCRRYLECDADADDAAQRALEKLFAQASDYDASRSVMAWALTLALFECRTLRRRAQRQRTESLDEHPDHSGDSPEDALERSQLRAALDAAMNQLSELDRETLECVLTSRDGDVDDSRFRKRKQRAVARLRQLWRNLYDT